MASNRAYDSDSMQKVINSLSNAIEQTSNALKYFDSVQYGSLSGDLRTALEERIGKLRSFLEEEKTKLNGDLAQMQYLKNRLEQG